MKVLRQIEDGDVSKVKDFYEKQKDNASVKSRREINVEGNPPKFSHPSF